MANQKVTVPDIGDYHDVPVIELLVQNGDAIDKDAPLLVIESDKATLEVPAPASGLVRNLKLKVGDKVSQGVPICELETAAAADRKSVVEGKSVSVRVDIGGHGIIKKKQKTRAKYINTRKD